MVNVKNLFGMAVMATALVSCSSSDDLATDVKGNESKTEAAYAKFTIQLPTVSGTRAVDPNTGADFAGGTADEYAVKDAQLLIFQKSGSSEGAYKFVETVNIGNLEPWTNNTPNTGVTRYANITAQLKGVSLDETGNEYFALVILNNAGQSKVTLPTSGTYSAWNEVAIANAAAFLDSSNGFYMSNAPLLNSGAPQTLVPIKGVYSTKAEAQNKPATTVYVERGMAKVSIGSASFASKPVDATTSTIYSEDKVQITEWTLDVMNKSTYPVHTTTGLTDKFAGIWSNDRFYAGADPQRVYWGTDPNYSTTLSDVDACKGEFYLLDREGNTYNGVTGSTVTWADQTKPLYCLENTFDIDNMKQGQTTRVVFKATYTPHNLTSTGVTTAADKTFFMIGNNPKIWTKKNLEQQIANKAKELLNTTGTVTATISGDLLTGGSHLLNTGNVTIKEGTVAKNDDIDFAKLNTKLGLDNTEKDVNGNPKVGIKTYENGVCYYIARIRHFNDALTPWSSGKETYGTNNVTNNASYLGRYGVLRNNWYDLEVTKFSAPGYPDVPVVNPTDPDDEDTKFINVEVKILDWAKRSQQVEL